MEKTEDSELRHFVIPFNIFFASRDAHKDCLTRTPACPINRMPDVLSGRLCEESGLHQLLARDYLPLD
jgi:hypothetical protein